MNGKRIGRYQLEKPLHQGMVATVYLAHDTMSGRQVVVKLLNAQHIYAPKKIERFLRDAQLGTKLRHTNIVPVYETGSDDGNYYIVMPYIQGGSLADLLEKRGALPPRVVADLGSQVASALDFAHQQRVIHRDVKPSNILLSPDLKTAYLADFGVARITGQRTVTEQGMLVGTPEFMSPEQVLGHKVDGRSDIYALGITLYLMLSGRLPFSGQPAAVLYHQVHSQPPSLKKSIGSVPKPMRRIVSKAMAKNPDRRQQRASALAVGLREPKAARSPSWIMWLLLMLIAFSLFFLAIRGAGNLDPISRLNPTTTQPPTTIPATIPLVTSTTTPYAKPTSTPVSRATSTTISRATSTKVKSDPTSEPDATRSSTRVSTRVPTRAVSNIALISPQSGANIKQDAAQQVFSWSFGRDLRANESFEIRFAGPSSNTTHAPFGWVKENHQAVNLNNLNAGGTLEWWIVVVRGTDGNWEADVAKSRRRTLAWEGS